MKLSKRIIEYLLIVGISYGLYSVILTPLFYFSIGLTVDQILSWLWQGFLVDLVIAYPAGKLIIWSISKYRRFLDD
ncbi:MAG: hypothetical protein IH795_00400 [Bacteroidetes bacterium]|nr:hypothetical protein [Bacteroidota bacterium]